ncbi:MAG: Mur ligase family protein, partial [Nannocystaceae bacterium]
MRWTPEAVATITAGTLVRSGGGPIAGAFFDSRKPIVGGLFVPIVAARDGHDFLDAAIDAGASAVLTGPGRSLPKEGASVIEVADPERAFATLARHARQQCTGPVIAITGSNGKTTTRALIEAVVASGYKQVLCTQGNFNNHLGVPLTILGEPHQPDAMVLEFGMSAPGENRHLAQIAEPTVSVITS